MKIVNLMCPRCNHAVSVAIEDEEVITEELLYCGDCHPYFQKSRITTPYH